MTHFFLYSIPLIIYLTYTFYLHVVHIVKFFLFFFFPQTCPGHNIGSTFMRKRDRKWCQLTLLTRPSWVKVWCERAAANVSRLAWFNGPAQFNEVYHLPHCYWILIPAIAVRSSKYCCLIFVFIFINWWTISRSYIFKMKIYLLIVIVYHCNLNYAKKKKKIWKYE